MPVKRKLTFKKKSGETVSRPVEKYRLSDSLNKVGGLLMKYPELQKSDHPDGGLSNLSWFYQTSGNVIVRKIAQFCNELDSGAQLDGRSWYLLVDTYKMAAYTYENLAEIIIRDDSFDRLASYLERNKATLKKNGIIPALIKAEHIWKSGMDAGYTLTPREQDWAKGVLEIQAQQRKAQYGDQKADSNSKPGRTERGGKTDAKKHPIRLKRRRSGATGSVKK